MAQIIDRTTRKPPCQPDYSTWEPSNPKWKRFGVEWENGVPKFPETYTIIQRDNGHGGSNTFWNVKSEKEDILVSINHKESPWDTYTYVHFAEIHENDSDDD